MIKVENIEVFNFEGALRGMRNPKNSWAKSDTVMSLELRHNEKHAKVYADIGENDLDLMRKLYRAGSEHRKYARQIFVSMDITAPLYWWKEMDQYRINVTTDSCSTMHTIEDKEFTLDDFSREHLFGNEDEYDVDEPIGVLNIVIEALNHWRETYLEENDKEQWWQMIQLLPTSYNQRRTITMNYENVFNIIHQRANHKLDEWKEFVNILTNELPYVREIMGVDA